MCWMAAIPLALGVVGGMQKGKGEKDSAYAQAKNMELNAQRNMETADDILVRGAYDADWQRVKTQQNIGTQRVAQAASGGMVDQDSNLLVNMDEAMIGELDAQTIANNAAREAFGYETQAMDLQVGANNMRKAGQNAQKNSILGGITSGMMGAASMGGFEGIGGAAGGVGASTAGNNVRAGTRS